MSMFSSIARQAAYHELLEEIARSRAANETPEVTLQKLEELIYQELSLAEAGY